MPRPRNQLTAGEWAILALLDEEPAHGFALARAMATGGEVGRVWDMRRPSSTARWTRSSAWR